MTITKEKDCSLYMPVKCLKGAVRERRMGGAPVLRYHSSLRAADLLFFG